MRFFGPDHGKPGPNRIPAPGDEPATRPAAANRPEVSGEVRAWGTRNDGTPWRVRLRHADGAEPRQVIDLKAGEALATSTCRAGRSPLDPRTGRVVAAAWPSVTVRGSCCATADAWAVAALVMQIPPGADGTITLPALERGDYVTAPSRQAAPTGARRAAP